MLNRYLSPSALNKLMDDPREYKKKYITFDEDKQRPSDTIVKGSLIHCHLANEDEKIGFKQIDWDLPSDKIQDILWIFYHNHYVKAGIDLTFQDDKTEGTIKLLELCKLFKFNQHLKTDKGRLDNFTKNGGDKYFNHLKMFKGKVHLISESESVLARNVSEKAKKDKRLREIINFESSAFEIKLTCEYNEFFGLQGILDNHWVSPDKNHLYINDFKTSELSMDEYYSKKLKSRFDNTVPNQMAQYDYLLEQTIGKEEYQDICVHRHVIYINQNTGDVYPFEISDETFTYWKINWASDVRKAEWHFTNDNFELPHDYQNYLVRV